MIIGIPKAKAIFSDKGMNSEKLIKIEKDKLL